jgi:lysozyme
MEAKISPAGLSLIKGFEGLRLTAYRDPVGILTIGFGHTRGVKAGQTITMNQASAFLLDDLADSEHAVTSCVTVPITQQQFDALVSFAFNVGAGALRRSTLLKLLNQEDYDGAAKQFGRWTHAGAVQLAGLVKRRTAEREMFQGSDVA